MRMPYFQLGYFFKAEYFMHHTSSVPENHFSPGHFVDICPEIFVGCKNDELILRKTFHYSPCVATGTNYITKGLDSRTAVDVTDNDMVRVLFTEFPEQRGRTTIAQRTSCFQIGNNYFFLWI